MPSTRSRKPPAHKLRRCPPFFHPVPLRTRRDGWTVERQCGFLAQLYATGSVAAAARGVGMSRASAYRLRGREGAQGFAWAWDRVLTPPGPRAVTGQATPRRPDLRKVTLAVLLEWLESGLVRPVTWRGRLAAIAAKPCDRVLIALLHHADAVKRAHGEPHNCTPAGASRKRGFGVKISASPRAPDCTGMGQGATGSGGRIDSRAGLSSHAAEPPRGFA